MAKIKETEIKKSTKSSKKTSIKDNISAVKKTTITKKDLEDTIAKLKEQLADKEEECAKLEIESKDKYLRLLADFDNYKKNAIKDKSNYMKYKHEDIAKDLIEVEEDIIRAVKANGLEGLPTGCRAIFDKFIKVLNTYKIVGKNINKGDAFNVDYMYAISSVTTHKIEQDKTVYDVVSPCYILNDKVIKYAQVVVYAYSE